MSGGGRSKSGRAGSRLTVILLANSEGLWWQNPLDAAEVHRSPFAALSLRQLAGTE